jgi:hypothetical protein
LVVKEYPDLNFRDVAGVMAARYKALPKSEVDRLEILAENEREKYQ